MNMPSLIITYRSSLIELGLIRWTDLSGLYQYERIAEEWPHRDLFRISIFEVKALLQY